MLLLLLLVLHSIPAFHVVQRGDHGSIGGTVFFSIVVILIRLPLLLLLIVHDDTVASLRLLLLCGRFLGALLLLLLQHIVRLAQNRYAGLGIVAASDFFILSNAAADAAMVVARLTMTLR
jgi:hypothetical protein